MTHQHPGRSRRSYVLMATITLSVLSLVTAAEVAALGTSFTYQGRLVQAGVPLTGTCDVRFALYGQQSGGTQIGSTEERSAVAVSDGLFTVQLGFDASAFSTGASRWVEIAIRCPPGSGAYTVLGPRQELTPTVYALYAVAANFR